jgi:hypothetical protein
MKSKYDAETAYCRSLGHYVPFKYCRTVSEGLPCLKIKDCWHEQLDIEQFINEVYTESERERMFSPHPDKISTILDIIKKTCGIE